MSLFVCPLDYPRSHERILMNVWKDVARQKDQVIRFGWRSDRDHDRDPAGILNDSLFTIAIPIDSQE